MSTTASHVWILEFREPVETLWTPLLMQVYYTKRLAKEAESRLKKMDCGRTLFRVRKYLRHDA